MSYRKDVLEQKLKKVTDLPEFLRHDPRYPNAFTLPSKNDQQNSDNNRYPFHFKGQERTDLLSSAAALGHDHEW